MDDILDNWIPLGCRDYHIKLFIFATILWGLWNIRNKMGIEHKFPRGSNEFFSQNFLLFTEVARSVETPGCQIFG